MTRRELMTGVLALPALTAATAVARPKGLVIESHVHLFAADVKRFPLSPGAPYQPQPLTVEEYGRFAMAAGISHAVIVQPEPYQDDHRYLEYCFTKEPAPDFFKGTCLFDPVSPQTPDRISALAGLNPGRIVALRIHEVRKPGTPPLRSGPVGPQNPIKDRDMRSPAMKATWKRVQQLKLAIQMHFLPYYAPQIFELASQFPAVPVILDHLGRAGEGTPAEFAGVLRLARLPRVYMKYSGPFASDKKIARRAFDAFGPDRMLWGYFGHDLPGYAKEAAQLDAIFDYASEADREKIRGGTARELFRFT
ncbi:MAG: amidohydrolase family protein [Terriglobia bacterium]